MFTAPNVKFCVVARLIHTATMPSISHPTNDLHGDGWSACDGCSDGGFDSFFVTSH